MGTSSGRSQKNTLIFIGKGNKQNYYCYLVYFFIFVSIAPAETVKYLLFAFSRCVITGMRRNHLVNTINIEISVTLGIHLIKLEFAQSIL